MIVGRKAARVVRLVMPLGYAIAGALVLGSISYLMVGSVLIALGVHL